MAAHPKVDLASLPGLRRPAQFYTHPPDKDLVSARLHAECVWEPFESRLWLAAQRSGDVVVDVGANLGYFTILSALAEAKPAAIQAFEPDPDNYALLKENLRLNGVEAQVRATRAALTREPGEGTLYRSTDNLGDHQIHSTEEAGETRPIPLLRGAQALSDVVDRIDLLKIDTQGSELAVIDGLAPLLQSSRSRLRALVEVTPHSLRAAGDSGRALIERLADLDLSFWIVDHIEHRLVECAAEELAQWCDNVDATPGDQGFMNIFVGDRPRL